MRLEARTSEGPAGTTELVTFSRPRVVSTLAALQGRGWRDGGAVTAISDGDPALQALVRSATGSLVKFILDWFQLSMRVHHVEQAMRGLCALQPPPLVPLDRVQIDIERLRHLLWNGYHDRACEALGRIASWATADLHRQELRMR